MSKLTITPLLFWLLLGCQTPESEEHTAKAQTADAQTKLTDTKWQMVQLNGKALLAPKGKANNVHFILHSQDKRITGFNGCNRFFGQYRLTGSNQIKISALGATKKACQGLAIKEQSVMRVFYQQAEYHMSADTLTFTDNNQQALASFRAL